MKYLLGLVLLCIVFAGCLRKKCGCMPPPLAEYLRAKIVQTSDTACSLPVLDFSEDSAHIRYISKIEKLVFSVTNLPVGVNILDKKLYVKVRTLTQAEEFACTAIGPSYPHLKVEDAKNRD